jgi:tetratricopeptide (TPR) repeat protein
MKTKVFLTLSVVFVMGLATSAYAQLVAGSPEDAAYTKIVGEDNPDAKTTLLLDFEKQFPQSKVLPDIYVMLMTIYQQKNDMGKANDFGERAIKIDAENITALITVSRNYSIEHKNLDKAVQYAQKAVDVSGKLKAQPPPPNFTPDQWKSYVDNTEQAAKSMLAYAKSLATP